MLRASVGDAELAYEIRGRGEPVLLIHGSHVADAFLPLATESALSEYRLIRYHRRGLGASTPHDGAFGIPRQAADAERLLAHLEVDRAHVVGHSYGAVTALQLASQSEVVHSLALLEPPLLGVPSGELLEEALAPAIECYQRGDPVGAVDAFMCVVCGADWREHAVRAVPGGAEQAERDASTFFEIEFPALGEWNLDADARERVSAPILYIIGGESGRFAEEGRDLAESWFPDVESRVVAGANHLLQVQKPSPIAEKIVAFLRRHPLPA